MRQYNVHHRLTTLDLVVFLPIIHASLMPIPSTFTLPLPIPAQLNSTAHLIPTAGYAALDTIYLTTPNSTSYTSLYFEAIASDLSAAVTFSPVLDYNNNSNNSNAWAWNASRYSTPSLLSPYHIKQNSSDEAVVPVFNSSRSLALQMSFAFPNGSVLEFVVPGQQLHVSTIGQASTGVAGDGSYSWVGAPDLSSYKVEVELQEYGVSGSIVLQSIVPPAAPCSQICAGTVGTSLKVDPGLYWIGLVPDAVATVNLKVGGTPITFVGSGYHDQRYSPISPYIHISQQYSGHARFSSYSIVWLYRISSTGAITASAYISSSVTQSGVFATCNSDDIKVRAYGVNGTKLSFPPMKNETGLVAGFRISVDGGGLGGVWNFVAGNVRGISAMPNGGNGFGGGDDNQETEKEADVWRRRWIGNFTASVNNGTRMKGFGTWEMIGPFL